MSTRVLLVDFTETVLTDGLQAAGIPFVQVRSDDTDSLQQQLATATHLAVKSVPRWDEQLLALAPHLRVMVRGGAGLEHIDASYLQSRGIPLFATEGGNADAVGEQAVGMLLSLLHKLGQADRQMRKLSFQREPNRGTELGNRTVGIIGYGHTGSALARKLQGFGCRILAYDKYKQGFGGPLVQEVRLDELQARADVVSLHVPLTGETLHMVDSAFIGQMAQPFWLLNLARGPVADTAAVIEGLRAGKILGAGLDVHENENFERLTHEQLVRQRSLNFMENVVLTPHTGGLSVESAQRIARRVLDILLAHR